MFKVIEFKLKKIVIISSYFSDIKIFMVMFLFGSNFGTTITVISGTERVIKEVNYLEIFHINSS